MLRQGLFAFAVLVMCISFATADNIKGKITKVDKDSITVTTKQDKDGKAFTVAKDCKFFKMVKKDDADVKEELKEGLKADTFSNIPAKGIGALIVTNNEGKVTEITLTGKKKKQQ
jgi:hypothetical protein